MKLQGFLGRLAACVAVGCVTSVPAMAQRVVTQGAVASDDRPANDPRAIEALLRRPVTIDLTRVPLSQAIDAVAAAAKVPIQNRADMVDAQSGPVSLHVSNVSLRSVLDQLLTGTMLRVVPDGSTRLSIVDASVERGGANRVTGIVIGVVRDAKTKQALRGAAVTLDDSVQRAVTDNDGRYRFLNVTVGSHRVTVRCIGYARQSKPVTVAEDATASVDIALDVSVNALDQVVVTATGPQRYRELGHVVSQVNADSLVREAPITSLSELLTARVPGLQVTGVNGGSAGGEVALRIRGTTTTSLDPQPIVIVDGVRYKSTNYLGSGGEDSRPFNVEPRSPLNDLNVNDIETVEVVKGPSASTLYGPDAANGVIVVTTKRGHAGKPEWHVYAYPDLNTLSVGSKDGAFAIPQYQGWGHVPNTQDVYQGQCTLLDQAAGQCILDSLVAVPTSTTDPQLSILAKQRPQWHSGASVSGGSGTQSYFFSSNWDTQTGSLQLPPIARQYLIDQLGAQTLSNAIKSPNSQQMLNLHMNVSSALGATGNVAVTGNYTQATQRNVSLYAVQTYSRGVVFIPGVPYSAQDSLSQLAQNFDPGSFMQSAQMQVHRLTAAATGSMQPFSWLRANGSIGIDQDNTTDQAVMPSGQAGLGSTGSAYYYTRGNTNRNASLGSMITGQRGALSLRMSLGLDYSYINQDGLNTVGLGLAPGSTDLSSASAQGVSRLWSETAQLGGYVEDVLGWRDRLFVTGSFRLDGSTSFGDAYKPRPYPKIGLSWVASDEPLLRGMHVIGVDELRLRASYGASSRYPTSSDKLGYIQVRNQNIEGGTAAEFLRTQGVNTTLRPERSREGEWGAEATVASNIRLGFTWYSRRTDDVLQFVAGPPGLLGEVENLGDLSAHGFEATVGARVFTSRIAALDVNFSYANNTNKVLSLGAGAPYQGISNSYAIGYPLGASFGSRTIGYQDSAGGTSDGYISQRSEILSSPVEYLGTNFPPRTYTFTPTLALFDARLRISSLFDRQAGGVMLDGVGPCGGSEFSCPATFLKSTPLAVQAINLGVNQGDFVRSSDFTRWREFNITGDVPLSLRRRMHLTRASASVQVRNLALWQKATKFDPESAPGLGVVPAGLSNYSDNIYGAPLPRTWAIRFDIAP